MKQFSADFILSPNGKLIENYTIVLNDDDVIIDLHPADSSTKKLKGILIPGFINTHCHLELSNFKGKIKPGFGLPNFIRDFVSERNKNVSDNSISIAAADKYMWENGIQGVADICNTSDSFPVKKVSNIRYHSFIELFNMNPSQSDDTISRGELLFKEAEVSHHHSSIVPHAPYSVPEKLFLASKTNCEKYNLPWSIHNQETFSENELFLKGTGALYNLFISMGINFSWFKVMGKSSLISIQKYFPLSVNCLLVHNTFTTSIDINSLKDARLFHRTFFSLCPNANLFIEKVLPDINMLYKSGANISIGTDSLASNNTLSILEELKTINKYFPDIPIETILTWATLNGAAYMKWDNLGSFKKGNNPGVLLLSGIKSGNISESSITRLI